MNLSVFEVLGPVMIGPSSSHTAGAARLGRVARMVAGQPFDKVWFGLHGSFAKTGWGHGTHQALLAGALGLREDDEQPHENTARIRFYHTDGSQSEIEGSSIGGGRILITRIDGMPAGFSAEAPTLLITQRDVKGVVSEISRTLAMEDINIGVMRVSREARGSLATTVIETDSPIPRRVADRLRLMPDILSVRIVDLAQ